MSKPKILEKIDNAGALREVHMVVIKVALEGTQ